MRAINRYVKHFTPKTIIEPGPFKGLGDCGARKTDSTADGLLYYMDHAPGAVEGGRLTAARW